jgi:hypothetical protein
VLHLAQHPQSLLYVLYLVSLLASLELNLLHSVYVTVDFMSCFVNFAETTLTDSTFVVEVFGIALVRDHHIFFRLELVGDVFTLFFDFLFFF